MHPKSKDRTGNRKLLDDVAKEMGEAKAGPGGEKNRRSKYGAKLAALREKKRD